MKRIVSVVNIGNIFRTLKYRNYRLYFTGQSISLIGTWIQMLAMGWLIYRLTNSAFILGFTGFVSRVPTLFFAPYAGVIVDRINKYKLLILTQILAMMQAVVITVLLLTGLIEVWHIIVLGAFLGFINSFDIPVRQALVIDMIEKKDDLSNAIALNSAIVNGARLIGPSLAGVLISLVGETWCFAINAISFIPILWTLYLMNLPPHKKIIRKDKPFKDLSKGFKYAFGFLPIRHILGFLALVSLLGMPFQVLMPVFAKDILGGGADSLGILMGTTGFGALVAALYLASKKTVLGMGRIIFIAGIIFGIGLILFSFSTNLLLASVILFFTGFGMMAVLVSSNTILQTIIDDEMRGRVMSFYTIAFMGMVPFGNLFAGWFGDMIGVQFTVALGGVLCILGGIYFALNLKKIRTLIRPIYIKKDIIRVVN